MGRRVDDPSDNSCAMAPANSAESMGWYG